jgi:hypothetical protein
VSKEFGLLSSVKGIKYQREKRLAMAELWMEFASALALIIGIIIGERFATLAFGRPKTAVLQVLELVIFVIAIVGVGRSVLLTQFDIMIILAVNFMIGVIAAVFSRGVSSGLGLMAELPKSRAFAKHTPEEKLAINTAKALAASGFNEADIRGILGQSGYPRQFIDSMFATSSFSYKPHPLVKRVAELEHKKR